MMRLYRGASRHEHSSGLAVVLQSQARTHLNNIVKHAKRIITNTEVK